MSASGRSSRAARAPEARLASERFCCATWAPAALLPPTRVTRGLLLLLLLLALVALLLLLLLRSSPLLL